MMGNLVITALMRRFPRASGPDNDTAPKNAWRIPGPGHKLTIPGLAGVWPGPGSAWPGFGLARVRPGPGSAWPGFGGRPWAAGGRPQAEDLRQPPAGLRCRPGADRQDAKRGS